MAQFFPGASLTLTTTVTDNGNLVDADTLAFFYRIGVCGRETALTPTRDSLGTYSVTFLVPKEESGQLHYRWDADGTYDVAREGRITIRRSAFNHTIAGDY